MDAVLKVVGISDKLAKVGEALGSGITGSSISSKSKYALTFGVAVAAIAAQALLVLIFLYLVVMLALVAFSTASRQISATRTLKDWYDQECFWNGPFLHSSMSKAKFIQLIASLLSFIIVVFGLSIVPDSGMAFGVVAFPALTTIKTILSSVPKTEALVASSSPEQQYASLQSEILSYPLKDLPEISLMNMILTPTSQLLARGEAVSLLSALSKLKAPEVAMTDIVVSTDNAKGAAPSDASSPTV